MKYLVFMMPSLIKFHRVTTSPDARRPAVTRHSALRSSVLMTAGTLSSRGLGFLRSILLVAAIGGTSVAVGGQAFDVANTLPMNLFMLIAGGAVGSVLVPQIVRALRSADGGQHYLSQVLTLTVVGGLVMTAVALATAPFLVKLYVPEWPPAWIGLATAMTYWCLPQIFFLIVFAVLGQTLNALSRFGAFVWAPVASNLVAIAGIVAFLVLMPSGFVGPQGWSNGMIAVVAGSATGGVVLQAAILGVAVWRTRIRFTWRWSFEGLGPTGRAAGWTFLGVLAGQIAYVFTSNAASAAGARLNDLGIEGPSLNSLSNAYLVVLLPHALVAVSVVTALFARVSADAADAKHGAVVNSVRTGVGVITLVNVIAVAVMITWGAVIGELLWGSPVIGQVVAVLSTMLPPFSVIYLTQRISLSYGNAKVPFIQAGGIAVVTALGSVLSAAWLPPRLVVIGIAVAIAGAHWLAALYGWLSVRKTLSATGAWHRTTRLLLARASIHLAAAVAAIVVGLLVQFALPDFGAGDRFNALVQLGLCGSSALITYAGVLLLTRDPSLLRLLPSRNHA